MAGTGDLSKLPKICARTGDTLADMRDRSTYHFDFSRLTDDDLTAVTQPCVFSYAEPHGFTLPATRFVSIRSTAAEIFNVETSPQLEYLGRTQILALAEVVGRTVASAGWKRSSQGSISREELTMRLRDASVPELQKWIIDGFTDGTVVMRFVLKRMHRGNASGGDLFLLSVDFRDEYVAQQALGMASLLRERDGLTRDSMGRRIDLDTYVARLKTLPR